MTVVKQKYNIFNKAETVIAQPVSAVFGGIGSSRDF
jgi:hypothetical protein